MNVENRLVCYDIKELGKQMKKIGMLVIQDQVWGRVTANRNLKKSTRYYMDEMHLLLKEEQNRRLLGGNLEAVPEVGRYSDRADPKRQRPPCFA